MDGAKARDPHPAIWASAVGADLGGSSKYSNENFEGRSGEGFHENSNWSWVTRS